MHKAFIIAKREFFELVRSGAFRWMLILGPLILLFLTYFLVKANEKEKQKINVLVTDPSYILTNRQIAKNPTSVDYSIYDEDFTIKTFKEKDQLQKFDAWIEINPKVLINKVVKVFCREGISPELKVSMQLEIERRVEEAIIENGYMDSVLSKIPRGILLNEFRNIKQPLNFSYVDLNNKDQESEKFEGYVGLVFACVIVLFLALFGMSIARSTAKDKSNRIVEVILSSSSSTELMMGKILGIGMGALLQFACWVGCIGIGLWLMRETIFPDLFDPSTWIQSSEEAKLQLSEQLLKTKENKLLDVLYNEVNYVVMLFHFIFLFVLSYFFYGTFFSWIGAISKTESDGQQFLLPIIGILFFSIVLAYIQVVNGANPYLDWFAYIPFTSFSIQLVRIAQGYYMEASYVLYFFSIFVLFVSSFLFLFVGGIFYKKNILNYSGKRRFFFWKK